jgi:L-lactate dehydrogenase complex protein LldG
LACDEVVARFVERVEEYGGVVVVTSDPAGAVGEVVGERTLGIPPDLPAALRPDGTPLVEDEGLDPAALDALDGALTCCAAACADTGTIALAGGPGEGRRALTLVPDLHVCVVRRAQIVETVPELFALLAPAAREGRPIVLVSGPSATSDIEFDRVEGVHGPRSLVVVLADDAAASDS